MAKYMHKFNDVLLQVPGFSKTLLPGIVTRDASITQIRHRTSVNVKYPRLPTMERRVLNVITRPIVPARDANPAASCTRKRSEERSKLSEFETFLLSNLQRDFETSSSGILAMYFVSSMKQREYRRAMVSLRKQGFELRRLNGKVFTSAIKGTEYETLELVLGKSSYMVFHPEPQARKMLTTLKKFSAFHLLCAVVEGQLLSTSQVEEYSHHPDRLGMLSQTCVLLAQPAQRLTQALTHHQSQLVQNLTLYQDTQAGGENEAEGGEAALGTPI